MLDRVRHLGNGWLTGEQMAVSGYASLRFMQQTSALIGMQKFPTSCAIEIAGLGGVEGTVPFLEIVEQNAVDLGATVHWGQNNRRDMRDVERAFDPDGPSGALFRWRKALSGLSHNGRITAFSTPFTRRRGLEVVGPIIQLFTATPSSWVCGGDNVRFGWNAFDNPPGTQCRLELRHPGPAGMVQAVIPLSDLVGARELEVPAGLTNATLAASYTLNGVTRTDRRTVPVRALAIGELISFSLTASCPHIDGDWRWGAEIDLTPGTVSASVQVSELSCAFGGFYITTARKAGTPDVSFTWLQQSRPVASVPLLGRWTFFFVTPGCAGPPPPLNVTFKVTCGL